MTPVILLKPMSSLEKCFLDENILFKPTTDRFTVFRGQPLCFQVAVSRGDEGEIGRSAAKSRPPRGRSRLTQPRGSLSALRLITRPIRAKIPSLTSAPRPGFTPICFAHSIMTDS